ncbi:dTDP-4-dehydrorhamnose 3,5-epimerase [Sphaerisporangium melleum]|uniref:dTDP-4-dehydrorhamnose 3,5-epimerase n=1 Tax=Sphaerisporangium melleum TaxID=321316 RepID=A0A917R082_9ACTN|nr:dTDP-4-dehydrorhamnose 3,5-epimerase [Sphaerisporangium melleum]GII69721.1 dTDP-4-dehydrorhamnose 3,5-epimerase [Sphaerisporangium melleum]
MSIADAYVFTPAVHEDDRGAFLEWYRADRMSEVMGHDLRLAQANYSVSRRGVVRGVHFADVPPGQAKYVTCVSGAVLDVIVDIRQGSPTFGRVETVELDDRTRRGVYLAEGLGHAFMVLSEQATVVYMCSEPYAPGHEHGVDPMDPEIGIPWPRDIEPLLSPKDAAAPTLSQALEKGLLPRYDDCQAYYAALRAGGAAHAG